MESRIASKFSLKVTGCNVNLKEIKNITYQITKCNTQKWAGTYDNYMYIQMYYSVKIKLIY